MAPGKKYVGKGLSPQGIHSKRVVTSNTEIKYGDPEERTISRVDMGGSTYLQSRQPGCEKNKRFLLP